MESLTSLLAICAALTVGVVSPGPSFVMIARTSVALSRTDGVAASLGMGVGGVLFAAAALVGLHVVLTALPWLYVLLKIGGGAWLLYLAWRIWRGAALPLALPDAAPATNLARQPTPARSFVMGLVTQVTNPKTTLVYASVFAALLPQQYGLAMALTLLVLVFAIESGWYALVALALSSAAPRAAYLRSKRWIDRVTGGVLAALGLRLMLSDRHLA
jgi:threonine/homoserine/homoserine lactone efflux protein